eukprot:CAMPEP_0113651054 /NCGR_PEP_ID=MMETSP0017_2-20120614/27202_1 /TAXON_ID=2856 /ORGANISM="Cylindrotheca closterium" /LENGTH=373 /DNA_ID=CAMNT_0000563677 /DNA_START=73 /DNA_END=1194 /DNA_ORIENTATION=+ /assembly_acc=CAM_ASM_000147
MDDENAPAFDPQDLDRFRLQGHPSVDEIDPDKIRMLPALAEDYYSNEIVMFGWEGILKAVLSGTRDKQSPLKILQEHETTIVREIYSYIANQWARHVKLTIPAALVGQCHDRTRLRFNYGRLNDAGFRRELIDDVNVTSNGFDDGFVAFSRCGRVVFPPPANRNVNMLPFIFGSKESLPDDLQCYHTLIEQCPYMADEVGKVGYLTVHESYVDATKAQRREGLHIESPGVFQDAPEDQTSFEPAVEHPWGMGVMFGTDRYEGGIFMASSVSNTSEVWDALVDKNYPGIVDKHGGCEYLRPLIGKGTKLQAGELIWMTDCTPHEALLQETSGYRQFFRVVSPYVSHWYADHNTSNPKVDLPKSVKIVKGNKFAK